MDDVAGGAPRALQKNDNVAEGAGSTPVLFIRITTLLKAPILETGVVSLLKVNLRWGIISYNMPG